MVAQEQDFGKIKNNQPKQFIDFGGWSLIEKTLERIKNPFFDFPILVQIANIYLNVKNY